MKTKQHTFEFQRSGLGAAALALITGLALLAAAQRGPAQTLWGNALSFDGVNDYMEVSNFGNAVPTNEVTVEFWLRLAATNKIQTIFRLEPDEGANRFMFDLRADGSVIWDFGNSGTGGRLWSAPSLTVTGAWQHFALVAKVGADNYMAIYRNGVLAANKSDADAFGAGSYNLVLGYRFTAPNAYYLSGELDEFRIWNKARTQAEIQADLHHPLTGAEPNLVAYWNFEEGRGAQAVDSTGHGHDGSLLNGPRWVESGLPRMITLRMNAFADRFYRVETTTSLSQPWQLMEGVLLVPAIDGSVQWDVPLNTPACFFRLASLLGIVDVMVTDASNLPPEEYPAEYTGVVEGRSTDPFIPGVVGERAIASNVSVGIEGAATRIWAKYSEFNRAQRVLTDIAVVNWAGGVAVCPEGHPLDEVNPCPDGWQRASGTACGIAGGLTPIAGNCWRNGLCVRYRPGGEVVTNNLCNIEHLSLSVTTNNALPAFPSGNEAWNYSHLNIQQDCGAVAQYVYVCYTRRIPPSPDPKLELLTRYAPLVWLNEDATECYYPSSVDWAFAHMTRFQNTADENRYWIQTTNTLTSPSDWTPAVFRGNLASAPVYAYWMEKQPDASVVDLMYVFYYPYNRGKEVFATVYGNHVGDFERVIVRLTNGQPEKILLGYHEWAVDYSWSAIAKTNLTHPIVYSARGSHGIWKDPGEHMYYTGEILGLGIFQLTDSCHAVTGWKTWERVVGFDYNRGLGLGTNEWPAWMSTHYTDAGIPPANIPGNGALYHWGNRGDGWVGWPVNQWRLADGCFGPAKMLTEWPVTPDW